MINMNEFLKDEPKEQPKEENGEKIVSEETDTAEEDTSISLDVQKAVVESLAAEKVVQDETIAKLRKDNYSLKAEISQLREKIDLMRTELEKVGDLLAKNAETPGSSKVSLLERDVEITDLFVGETRDHVLEVIKDGFEKAEQEGRFRRAKLLEGVLLANEGTGELAKRRKELKDFFVANQNILTGPVIAKLEESGIQYKNGEEYLLTEEILKRTY